MAWKLDDNGLLTISGTGDMDDYASYSETPWYSLDYETVVVEDGVTSLGDHAFAAFHLWLPTSVTDVGTDNIDSYTEVYYAGTEDQFDAMYNGDMSDLYTNAVYGVKKTVTVNATGDGSGTFLYAIESNYSSDTRWEEGSFGKPLSFDVGEYVTLDIWPGSGSRIEFFDGPGYYDDSYMEDEVYFGFTVTEDVVYTVEFGKIPTSGSCGDNVNWSYADGVLTITGSGAMDDYDWGDAPWYVSRSDIATVVIDAGVTSIGSYAF